MEDSRLLSLGVAGTVITAVCCFTPALVLILSALGLSAAVGWLDYVLLPGASRVRCFDCLRGAQATEPREVESTSYRGVGAIIRSVTAPGVSR